MDYFIISLYGCPGSKSHNVVVFYWLIDIALINVLVPCVTYPIELLQLTLIYSFRKLRMKI